MADLGFEGTRPVQGAVIPLALAGHDVVACAETGTGKTLAFAVPILQRLLTEQPHYGDPAREPYTRALILAPTRELAVQIEDTLVGLTYHAPVTTAPVFGGVEMGPQERALRAGVDIVVATPGRLMDHMRHDAVDLLRVQVLVLDEADRMMDMGFWPDVQRILAALPPDRQTLLFSATLPGEILRMATEMLREPRCVQVVNAARPARFATSARPSTAASKIDWLAHFIRRDATGPVLVFVRMKVGADRVARNLQAAASAPRRCMPTARSRSAWPRSRVSGRASTPSSSPPTSPPAAWTSRASRTSSSSRCRIPRRHVHRVGRTGRSGATGHAVTLVSPAEERAWRAVEQAVGFHVA